MGHPTTGGAARRQCRRERPRCRGHRSRSLRRCGRPDRRPERTPAARGRAPHARRTRTHRGDSGQDHHRDRCDLGQPPRRRRGRHHAGAQRGHRPSPRRARVNSDEGTLEEMPSRVFVGIAGRVVTPAQPKAMTSSGEGDGRQGDRAPQGTRRALTRLTPSGRDARCLSGASTAGPSTLSARTWLLTSREVEHRGPHRRSLLSTSAFHPRGCSPGRARPTARSPLDADRIVGLADTDDAIGPG